MTRTCTGRQRSTSSPGSSGNRHGLREPVTDQGKPDAVVDLAVSDAFQELEEEETRKISARCLAQFLRLYSFLAHIIVFKDPELEKLHEYGRWLIRKLPRAEAVPNLDLDDEVALAAYRLDGKPPVGYRSRLGGGY